MKRAPSIPLIPVRIARKRDSVAVLEKRIAMLEARIDWLERDAKDAKRKGK